MDAYCLGTFCRARVRFLRVLLRQSNQQGPGWTTGRRVRNGDLVVPNGERGDEHKGDPARLHTLADGPLLPVLADQRKRDPRLAGRLTPRNATRRSFPMANRLTLPAAHQYRPPREIRPVRGPYNVLPGKRSTDRAGHIVLSGKQNPLPTRSQVAYRPAPEAIQHDTAPSRACESSPKPGCLAHIVPPGKIYRPAQEMLSSSPGNWAAFFAANVRFSHGKECERPVFVCVNCLLCCLWKKGDLSFR